MSEQERENPPRFRGVTTHRDPQGRFSFRYPSTWNSFDLTEDREGVLFSPEATEPATYFAAWVSELPERVVAEDASVLAAGVAEGLSGLDSCTVLESHDDVISNLVKFDRIYTFSEEGVVRKRRVWMLYVDSWQIVLVYQGSSPEEYDYWISMGNYAFATFELPQELWFATDRDLGAVRSTS